MNMAYDIAVYLMFLLLLFISYCAAASIDLEYCTWIELGSIFYNSALDHINYNITDVYSDWDCKSIYFSEVFGSKADFLSNGAFYSKSDKCPKYYSLDYLDGIVMNNVTDVPIGNKNMFNQMFTFNFFGDPSDQGSNFTVYNSTINYDIPCPICNTTALILNNTYVGVCYGNCNSSQSVMFDSNTELYKTEQCIVPTPTNTAYFTPISPSERVAPSYLFIMIICLIIF